MKLAPKLYSCVIAAALSNAACSGHVSFFAGHPTFDEKEPNDSVHSAPFFGGVRAGTRFDLTGHIDDDSSDPYDGFALRADEPCTIQFELESHEAFTDLDVCVYDPELDEYVVCCDGPFDPEKGSITLLEPGKVVHFVVSSARGDTRYTLRVRGDSAIGKLAATPAHVPIPADTEKARQRQGYAHADEASETDAPRDEFPPRRVEITWIDLDRGETLRTHAVRIGRDVIVEAESRPLAP